VPSSSQVSFSITHASAVNCQATIEFSGIKFLPTSGTPLASGNFTVSSTGSPLLATLNTGTRVSGLADSAGAFSASASTVSPSPATVENDGVTTSTITVTITDQFSNPLSGKTVTLAQTGGAGTPTISAASGPSDVNGQVTFTVKSTTVATDVFTATDVTDGSTVITQTATVNFVDTTAPAVPTLNSPSSGAIVQPTGLILDWNDATDPDGPVTYQYESSLSNTTGGNNALTSLLYGPAPLASSQVDASGSADNTYYWQVRACDAYSNCSTWSGPWQVTIDGTAPTNPTDVASTSHTISVPSATNVIDMAWTLAGSAPGATDALSGVDGYSYDFTTGATDTPDTTKNLEEVNTGVSSTALADGTWYFNLRTVDNAGNWSTTVHSGPYIIDTTAPAVPTLVSPADGSFQNPSGLGIDWTDSTDPHGPVTYYYQSSLSNTTGAQNGFTSPIYTSGALTDSEIPTPNTPDGTYYWQSRACDALNNCSDWSGPYQVKVDGTAPATLSSGIDASWHKIDVQVTLSCSDGSGSGCATTYYTTDNSDPTTSGTRQTYTVPFTLSGTATYPIKYYSVDNVGNQESTQNGGTVKLDETLPAVPVIGAIISPTNNTTVAWAWTEAADINSGIQTFAYTLKDAASTVIDSGTTTLLTYSHTVTDGVYNFFVHAVDNANNPSADATSQVLVDTIAPTTPVASPTGTTSIPAISVTLSSSDTNTFTIYYTIDGSDPATSVTRLTYSTPVVVDHSLILKAVATDVASNTSSPVMSETYHIAPVLTGSVSNETTTTPGTEQVIVWDTVWPSTSRVIYGLNSVADPLDLTVNNYGYQFSTALQDNVTPVTHHVVTLTGLQPTKTYYYRVISAGSPETISSENQFQEGAANNGAEGTGGGGHGSDNSSSTTTSGSGTTSTGGKVLGITTKAPSSTTSGPAITGTQVAINTGTGSGFSAGTSGQVSGTETSATPTPSLPAGQAGPTPEVTPTPEASVSPTPDITNATPNSNNKWWYLLAILVVLGIGYYIFSRRQAAK
jgi:hypothetical protein